ncbi:MAG: hypothetical protein RBR38_08970 [Desulfomicrobium apsheronum]|nr:hypothetical protein [Desulfomicrobium apsheronum]
MSALHTLRLAAVLTGTLCFLIWPLSDPATCAPDSAGQEMRELEQEGKLTVRALRGWNMLPAPFMRLALELHQDGIDILGADVQKILSLAHEAKSANAGSLAKHVDTLEALAKYMQEFAARQANAPAAPLPDGPEQAGGEPSTAPPVRVPGPAPGPALGPALGPVPVPVLGAAPVQDSDLLGTDDYDWRNTPDLQAEKQAIGQRQNDFRQAMDRKDIAGATALIAKGRRDVYAALFAANPDAMPSFGALFEAAEITFLSPPAEPEKDPTLRTAEYALELDGFTFYTRWIKDGDTWFLADF